MTRTTVARTTRFELPGCLGCAEVPARDIFVAANAPPVSRARKIQTVQAITHYTGLTAVPCEFHCSGERWQSLYFFENDVAGGDQIRDEPLGDIDVALVLSQVSDFVGF